MVEKMRSDEMRGSKMGWGLRKNNLKFSLPTAKPCDVAWTASFVELDPVLPMTWS